MYPPADPWGERAEPTPMYGRASVPVPTTPLREPTAELPPVPVRPLRRSTVVSWEKVKKESRRNISDGWGFTAAGVIIIFSGWGVWAAAGRGSRASPWPGFVLALLTGGAIFVLARFLGYLVLERMWGRNRPHARWSHLVAGLFLTFAGVSYLINTKFFLDSWIRDTWDFLGDQLHRLL